MCSYEWDQAVMKHVCYVETVMKLGFVGQGEKGEEIGFCWSSLWLIERESNL